MDVKKHLVKLQGKDYLPVAARIVAFREAHPTGVISTELVGMEPVVIVRASIHSADGVQLATGYGTAPLAGKGSYAGRGIEKAETAAIGRALAHAGFGTLYATDANDDDGDNLADSPIPAPANDGGWTSAQFEDLKHQAAGLFIAPEHVLGVLGVGRIRDYTPGYDRALEMLKAHAAARDYKQNGGAK